MRSPGVGVGVTMLACALTACSFQPGPFRGETPDDAAPDPTIDAAPDAPPDAPPTWQVVETIIVDSTSSTPKTSATVLANGTVYRLRASGTLTATINGEPGDADYWDFDDPKDDGCCEDIGLGIDDLVVDDLDTQPDWGEYTDTHIYEVEWTGKGATITALYQDTVYGNNAGSLTLEILELR